MPVETAVSEALSVTKGAARMTEKLVKKAWSIADAAAEKKPPSEYLSPKAIKSIQGQ